MRSHRPFGPYISKDGWTTILEDFRGELDVVGEVLRFHLDGPATAARPKLMNMFLHALIWFHEACRERLPLLATVKFAATLDALAGGGGRNAILDLLEVRLGVQRDHALFGDGTTAATAIDEIYSEARSRTVHETNEKLQRDWSGKRGRAEQIARLCLIGCLAWASEKQDTDDPRAMTSVQV
ncbi:MAG: hypothetical protein A49_22710 [Methyloceanibacter sp.]|nr:MAG: hypothetical protein A49_22710 [Methyloceanibacter sp.]